MKNLLKILVALFFCLPVAFSCNKSNIIPDSTLKTIFKEVFLTNAYINQTSAIVTDSLDVYRPVLAKYGYTLQDLDNTVMNFSRRKSARLSDVMEAAIAELQSEADWYSARVAVLDTIEARSLRMFRQVVYTDTLITARSIADTAKLRVTVPVREGTYEVSFNYSIDTADKNTGLRNTLTFIDSTGRKGASTIGWMSNRRRLAYKEKVVAKQADTALVLIFGNYTDKLTRPHLTVDSLKIVYYPPLEVAVDSAWRVLSPYRMPDFTIPDTIENEADSSSLHIPRPEIDPVRSPDGR